MNKNFEFEPVCFAHTEPKKVAMSKTLMIEIPEYVSVKIDKKFTVYILKEI